MAAAGIQRWTIILFAYDYKLWYRSGKEKINADSMSRLHFDNESYEKHSVMDNRAFLKKVTHAPVTA